MGDHDENELSWLVVSLYPSYQLPQSSAQLAWRRTAEGIRVSIKMGVENNLILSKIVWITRWKKISRAERERNHILSVISEPTHGS